MINFRLLARSLRLVPGFLRLARHTLARDSPFYHEWNALESSAVVREEFLSTLCTGRRVLHFGFVDAPFSEARIKSHNLLHQKIQKVATHAFGLDVDRASLETYREMTGDHQNAILDVTAPLSDAEFLRQNYDVILFPEVLEHLLKPADALENLRRICLLNPGALLCITTPNAYSIMGFFTAISGDELVHPDHYFYFSPATLRKLLRDTGFSKVDLSLYSTPELLSSPGLTKHGLIAVCSP